MTADDDTVSGPFGPISQTSDSLDRMLGRKG
jgi:hypothetical protein